MKTLTRTDSNPGSDEFTPTEKIISIYEKFLKQNLKIERVTRDNCGDLRKKISYTNLSKNEIGKIIALIKSDFAELAVDSENPELVAEIIIFKKRRIKRLSWIDLLPKNPSHHPSTRVQRNSGGFFYESCEKWASFELFSAREKNYPQNPQNNHPKTPELAF